MIVNPSSASASKGDSWKDSEKFLQDGGLEVEALVTERPGHAIDLAREAAEKGERQFIAVGGDGTIHEVMSGLLRYADASGVPLNEFTLGVLPYGTGNDWIKTAGVPADMKEAAACILRGNTVREDVVRLTFENGVFCMANIGGIGLDADICYHTNNLKAKGRKGDILYKMVAPYSIFTKKRDPVEVVCDGEKVYSGKLYTLVIANGVFRGGGLKQNAPGVWNDGLLEMSLMGNESRIGGMKKMMHIFSGDFAVLPGILSRQFHKMTVRPLGGTPDRVESDGELPGTLPVTVELTDQQINVIIP